MQNRYKQDAQKLEKILTDMLNTQKQFIQKDPQIEHDKYVMGYIYALEHMLKGEVEQYAKSTQDQIDALIGKKGKSLTERILKYKGITKV